MPPIRHATNQAPDRLLVPSNNDPDSPTTDNDPPTPAPPIQPLHGLLVNYAKLLGDGGCGEIFQAEYLGAPVAVKRLLSFGNSNNNNNNTRPARRQFYTEHRRLREMRHLYVVQFYDLVTDPADHNRHPLIVMELCRGGNLYKALHTYADTQANISCNTNNDIGHGHGHGHLLRSVDTVTSHHCRLLALVSNINNNKNNSTTPTSPTTTHYRCRCWPRGLPLETIERVAVCLADGLQYIHGIGYSHGDLKPHNILLTHPLNMETGHLPDGAIAKLCDFGLSRRLYPSPGSPQTPSLPASRHAFQSTQQGTYQYFSPEAFSKIPPNRPDLMMASDIYACGVLLYELLTLRHVWPGEPPLRIMQKVVHAKQRPPWPDDLHVDAGWRILVERCWHQEPSMRPSAEGLSNEVHMLIEGRRRSSAPSLICSRSQEGSFSDRSSEDDIMSCQSVISEIFIDESHAMAALLRSDSSSNVAPLSPIDASSHKTGITNVHPFSKIQDDEKLVAELVASACISPEAPVHKSNTNQLRALGSNGESFSSESQFVREYYDKHKLFFGGPLRSLAELSSGCSQELSESMIDRELTALEKSFPRRMRLGDKTQEPMESAVPVDCLKRSAVACSAHLDKRMKTQRVYWPEQSHADMKQELEMLDSLMSSISASDDALSQ